MRWISTSVVVRSLMTGGSWGMASWKIWSSSDSTRFNTSPPSASTSLHSKYQSHNVRTYLQLQATIENKPSQSTAAVRLLYKMQQHLSASEPEIQKFLYWLQMQTQSKKRKSNNNHTNRISFSATELITKTLTITFVISNSGKQNIKRKTTSVYLWCAKVPFTYPKPFPETKQKQKNAK